MALTLWTGNEVYLYLTVAFIQVCKGGEAQAVNGPRCCVRFASLQHDSKWEKGSSTGVG